MLMSFLSIISSPSYYNETKVIYDFIVNFTGYIFHGFVTNYLITLEYFNPIN